MRKPYPRFHCAYCRKKSYGQKHCSHCDKTPRRGSIEDENGNLSRPSFFDEIVAKTDTVNHPSHYTAGKVECIDAIESATTELTGIQAVCTANVIKYVWRWKRKNGAEDLRKAKWYLDKLIKEVDGSDPEQEQMVNQLKQELAEERAAHNSHVTELCMYEDEVKRLRAKVAELEDAKGNFFDSDPKEVDER